MEKDFRKEVKIGEHLKATVFYVAGSSHDVVCINFRTTVQHGHFDFHIQMSRPEVQELAGALNDLDNQFPTEEK